MGTLQDLTRPELDGKLSLDQTFYYGLYASAFISDMLPGVQELYSPEGLDEVFRVSADMAAKVKKFYKGGAEFFSLLNTGVAVGGLFAFVWAMGEYAVPSLLGSSSQRTISIEVADQILTVLNWPFGASIAFTLLMISVAVLFISNRLSHKSSAYMHR